LLGDSVDLTGINSHHARTHVIFISRIKKNIIYIIYIVYIGTYSLIHGRPIGDKSSLSTLRRISRTMYTLYSNIIYIMWYVRVYRTQTGDDGRTGLDGHSFRTRFFHFKTNRFEKRLEFSIFRFFLGSFPRTRPSLLDRNRKNYHSGAFWSSQSRRRF